ncbi:MAG: SDR family oxidoreductase [Salibacteraceae bacterium]
MSKKAFVLGASGFQGSAIARKMISNGYVVSTLSSDPAKPTLPAAVEVIEGGLNAPSLIEEALKGVAVAIYTFPVLFDLEKARSYTQNFIAAAKNQRVPLVIYNSSADVPDSPTGLLGQDLKIEIQDMLEKSGLSVLTLMPDIYLDNLAAPWSIPLVLEKKILPYPIKSGAKIPWISHEDLARFVAAAPGKPSLAGQKSPIGGTL